MFGCPPPPPAAAAFPVLWNVTLSSLTQLPIESFRSVCVCWQTEEHQVQYAATVCGAGLLWCERFILWSKNRTGDIRLFSSVHRGDEYHLTTSSISKHMQSPDKTVDGGRPTRIVQIGHELKKSNVCSNSWPTETESQGRQRVSLRTVFVKFCFRQQHRECPCLRQQQDDEKHQQTDQCQQNKTAYAVPEGGARAEEAMI